MVTAIAWKPLPERAAVTMKDTLVSGSYITESAMNTLATGVQCRAARMGKELTMPPSSSGVSISDM